MKRGSSSTRSRSSSYTRGYRTLAPTSQVDETLFGSPKHKSPEKDKHGNPNPKNQSRKTQGETVQIVTKDLIRNLRIPLKDPSGDSTILPSAEFKRITSTSQALTKEGREALRQAYQKKKDEEIKAAEERKNQIYEADLSRKENPALTELELEARDRAQRLVERANALRMEEEDEIKKLNKLILAAQCQATRDAQIDEKKQIQAELSEEEKRLDAMMEVERRKALETGEQIDEERKQKRIGGMQNICDQIRRHLNQKQMQEVMKEQEKEQTREKLEKMNLEDLKVIEKKKEEQQRLQEEIMRINTETMKAKEQRREEEKLADMRNMEYMRNKMGRDAEYEVEQRRIKKEKELEIARLRARQEKAKDYKSEQDELRAKRNQEATDREWRRKEKELLAKKAQEKAMLRAARAEQVHCKEQLLSIEAGREKAEFERVLKAQQEAIIKLKKEEEKHHQEARKNADAIRNQVKEHVISAVAKRREIFKEANQFVEEARQRRVRLDEIKEKKLKELKATGLSEKYCSEVERKARACAL
ncbi:cilia- and flagella-associated protein 45 [Anoplopoma fimbria]|uniref:cilia- and flagella-associated protein 45 n=1 Tax=Anoplopoma fimbria TaxID=229290 RepID=UPI0023EDEB68|nr:cilia- and flagella-associated protein 45 [Anoplopoma fimbria]